MRLTSSSPLTDGNFPISSYTRTLTILHVFHYNNVIPVTLILRQIARNLYIIAFKLVVLGVSVVAPVAASRASSEKREYVYIRSNEASSRSGKLQKNLFEDLPESFVADPGREFSHRRSALLDTCGPVDLDGLDPISDANTVAMALVGNSGVNIVPGSAIITSWPGYGMISSWKAGHAISPSFPNGSASKFDFK